MGTMPAMGPPGLLGRLRALFGFTARPAGGVIATTVQFTTLCVPATGTATVGAQNNRFPVYNAAGTLLGYVPIYDAS